MPLLPGVCHRRRRWVPDRQPGSEASVRVLKQDIDCAGFHQSPPMATVVAFPDRSSSLASCSLSRLRAKGGTGTEARRGRVESMCMSSSPWRYGEEPAEWRREAQDSSNTLAHRRQRCREFSVRADGPRGGVQSGAARESWSGYRGVMPSAQSIALTTLVLALAIAPLVATLMWWLRSQQSLSEIIQEARR